MAVIGSFFKFLGSMIEENPIGILMLLGLGFYKLLKMVDEANKL